MLHEHLCVFVWERESECVCVRERKCVCVCFWECTLSNEENICELYKGHLSRDILTKETSAHLIQQKCRSNSISTIVNPLFVISTTYKYISSILNQLEYRVTFSFKLQGQSKLYKFGLKNEFKMSFHFTTKTVIRIWFSFFLTRS